MPITDVPRPGQYPCVPPATYFGWHALSHSWMNKLRISPAHLADMMEHGYSEKGSTAMDFGSAVHCRVLESPSEYAKRYAIRPEGQTGTTKDGKAFKAEANLADMTVLSCQDGRWCEAVAYRAKMNHRLREWLDKPHDTEMSLVWERDGYMCKGRADLIVPSLHVIADLKTTVTASPKGFALQVARYHYHEQAAWYLDGMRRLTGAGWAFYFIACEKQRPFLVTCHQLVPDSPAYTQAVAENDRLFELYTECCQSGKWPGYGDVFEIELPEWALQESGEVPESEDEPF